MGGTLQRRAQELRGSSTDTERELWKHIRREQIGGYKFRRQHPIGNYIVDFVFLKKNIVVELDGGQHRERRIYDEKRTAWLAERGYQVLRFWDNEIYNNIEGVKKVIWDAVPPHLDPSFDKVPSTSLRVFDRTGSPQEGRRLKRDIPQRKKRTKEAVYLGLGSNIGDGERQIRRALRAIDAVKGVAVRRVSALYLSEPVGGPPQPWYSNAVAEIETSLTPEELLDALQRIEADMGRVRAQRNAARPIDLDILLFGERMIASRSLTIPHPRMTERRFVLEPLAEIASDIVHPANRLTVEALRKNLADGHRVIRKGCVYERY
ncbi:MAG: 2-amino-4-hydroxy-6-hydroxymethyldihydropteridine diphosphokinase [Candidatus Aureabacteria bacterium]|nr:2-amino-4-hydroxy-6-hydroxymethyldihydropteridine diphosphokinase [Candidatus Auribacterota bacterium]